MKKKDPRHFPIDKKYVEYMEKHTKTGTDKEHEKLVNKFYGYNRKEKIIFYFLIILGIITFSLCISFIWFYNNKPNFIGIFFTNLLHFFYFKIIFEKGV